MRTPEQAAYYFARNRCNNPGNKRYASYGGRGIECRFNSFADFFAAVGARPSPEHSLDRIDVNGHYEAGNVRWATRMQQHLNMRVKPKSGHHFVYPVRRLWFVKVQRGTRQIYGGMFNNIPDAVKARNTLLAELGIRI